jgi:hypothetical protein
MVLCKDADDAFDLCRDTTLFKSRRTHWNHLSPHQLNAANVAHREQLIGSYGLSRLNRHGTTRLLHPDIRHQQIREQEKMPAIQGDESRPLDFRSGSNDRVGESGAVAFAILAKEKAATLGNLHLHPYPSNP